MKNYGSENMLELLREAVNIAAHGEKWHHKHMLWAQSHGLQGHKRLNRYESGRDREHCIKMQNYCIDMFGEVIKPEWNYELPPKQNPVTVAAIGFFWWTIQDLNYNTQI